MQKLIYPLIALALLSRTAGADRREPIKPFDAEVLIEFKMVKRALTLTENDGCDHNMTSTFKGEERITGTARGRLGFRDLGNFGDGRPNSAYGFRTEADPKAIQYRYEWDSGDNWTHQHRTLAGSVRSGIRFDLSSRPGGDGLALDTAVSVDGTGTITEGMIAKKCPNDQPFPVTGPLRYALMRLTEFSVATQSGAFKMSDRELRKNLLAGKPFTLKGTGSYTQVFGPHATETTTVELTYHVGPVETIDLVVEPVGYGSQGRVAYQDWIPEGTETEIREGSRVELTARLRTRSGRPVPADKRAVRVSFILTATSHQPGTAMNWPPRGVAAAAADLSFVPGSAPPGQDETPERVDRTGSLVEARANLYCFDWGAFGSVKVTARLASGDELVGHLGAPEGTSEILIPLRTGSLIADGWKRKVRATGHDDDDEENLPIGADSPGDGLTLYEEYRGFYEGKKHISADPARKDLLIRNDAGVYAVDGIELLQTLTGLVVHRRLRGAELDPATKLVNANHDAETPHRGDQHGIFAELGRLPHRGFSDCDDHHLTLELEMPLTRISVGTAGVYTNEDATVVAHELGHCIHIAHHGSTDRRVEWDTNLTTGITYESTGNLFGEWKVDITGKPAPVVRLLHENGTPYHPTWKARVVWVGFDGGQHSGVEDCIMRYDVADAYVRPETPDVRYLVDENFTGAYLCSGALGTGVNEPHRKPRPQFGNATAGNCKWMFCVNDTRKCHGGQ